MRLIGLLACFFLCFSSISIAQKLKTKIDTISYAAGLALAEDLKGREANDLDIKIFLEAFKAGMGNKKTQIDKENAGLIFSTYLTDLRVKPGKTFLETNAKNPGVVTLPSGLQYQILTKGIGGAKPLATDKVKTHYHGMLISGEVFDSSVERGEPISFPLNQVIPGWTEGVQLMSVGDKFKFFIPYHLAYGERGAGAVIPPYATLIFEVELLGINED